MYWSKSAFHPASAMIAGSVTSQNACRNRNYQLSGYETQARAQVCEYDCDSNKGHLSHKQTGHQLHQYEFERKHVSLTDIVTMWFAFCES